MRFFSWIGEHINKLEDNPEVNSRFVYFLQSVAAITCSFILVIGFTLAKEKSLLWLEMLFGVAGLSGVSSASRYALKTQPPLEKQEPPKP